MRFAVDAHAIGRHLTGNEVYVRNLLNGFASLDSELEFIAYLSTPDAEAWVPSRFTVHRIAGNPFVRLGCDLSYKLRRDRPQLVHVQYTAPLDCPVPVVVSAHSGGQRVVPRLYRRRRRSRSGPRRSHSERSRRGFSSSAS